MTINIIVKVLFLNAILAIPMVACAWTVSEKSDEEPLIINPIKSVSETSEEAAQPVKSRETFKVKHKEEAKESKEGFFEKNPTRLTAEERINGEYRRALEYLQDRDFPQAEMILKANLQQLPTHHISRVELATHYLKNDQVEEAEFILNQGLRYDETHPDYLRLMAVICDRNQEPEKALSLMMKVKDSQRQENNYISFLGHIYQELGSYSLARQQYFKLLQRDPQNPLWLLGVSVALDGEGQREAALEGYHRLNRESSFEPDVRQYIKERIKRLKG